MSDMCFDSCPFGVAHRHLCPNYHLQCLDWGENDDNIEYDEDYDISEIIELSNDE